MTQDFDAIIIGAGQAGPSLAQQFDQRGMKVAVIERKNFGGTCVNYGCVPTKTIVASAKVAQMARRAAEYGVELENGVRVDMARVKARKDEIVVKKRDGIAAWMDGLENGTVFRGHARFAGSHSVEVDGALLSARQIFINTGGRAFVPEISGLDSVPYLTSTSMLDVDVLPEHLIIIGGSYIGLEFAQAFRRFGSRVTVIEMADRLIAREDADVSDAVKEILEAEGIEVRLNAKCFHVEKRDKAISLSLVCAEGAHRLTGSHLLVAVGRRPNTDDLGLENTGIKTDAKGFITVDDECRTNVDGIWAIGDVNGRGAFTHTSYNDYEIVAANLFSNDRRKISERIPTYGLFIDPPLGRAGMTEGEIRQKGIRALVAKRMMTSVSRARERGETQGFMKVAVDAESRKILGAAILGIGGDEIIHALLDAMAAGTPADTIIRTMHIHPTVSEYLPTILQDLKPLEQTIS